MPSEPAVVISSAPMRIIELLEIASGRRLELDPEAIAIIKDRRATVDAARASGRPVYGLNMELGHMKDARLPDDQLRVYQETMVKGHAGAFGPPLPRQLVRAAMAVRVNGIARGGAGASFACVETLVAMLNAGVHPVVPGVGSVGAGDLSQMAAIAMVALGRGEAEFNGQTMSGMEALQSAGIQPLRLEPKDGLTLMSANGISVGQGAIVVTRAMEALELANLSAVLSLEASSSNPSGFEPAAAAASGVQGQAMVSDHVRALLRGSRIPDDDPSRTIQDPLSFQVVAQVHGALWEFTELARRSVESELNAMTDNPLVSREDRRIIHNGNFHPMVLALAFDALRPALAHTGQLSDRRLSHLWAVTFTNRTLWAPEDGTWGASLRYAAAAASTELRQLAEPASLDCPPLDLGIEDHATGAPLSVRRSDVALERLEEILAVELLMARDVLIAKHDSGRLGAGARALLQAVTLLLRDFDDASSAAQVHAAVHHAMRMHLLTDVGQVAGRLSWGN